MKQVGDVYSVKGLITDLLFFGLMVVSMKLVRGTGFLVLTPLILLAVLKNDTRKILLFMMITSAAMVGNGWIMPKNSIFSLTHKVIMVVMAVCLMVKLAGKKHSMLVTPLLGMIPYIFWMALSSSQGWAPLLSFLKLFLFTSCYFAFYSMANSVILDRRVSTLEIRSCYLSLCVFMLLGSVLLIPFPGISQMQMEAYMEAVEAGKEITSLFCGMTFHSQSLGPIVSILFVILLSDLLFSVRKYSKLHALLLLCCPVLVYKTSSRTAMGTLLAGGLFTLFLFMKSRNLSAKWKGKVTSTAIFIAIIASVWLLVSGSGRESLARFVLKQESAVSLDSASFETVISSRQGLMDRSMENFRKKPLLGNGFQITEDYANRPGGGGLKSILSAPIEKGVWITAVLEEGGAVGLALLSMFVVVAIFKLSSKRAYATASVLFSIFLVNLGEFTMFSMSGIGGFCWCLCFVAAVIDAQHAGIANSMNTRPWNGYYMPYRT